MGTDDRVEAKGDQIIGNAKEFVGGVTGDEQLENEGRLDQVKGKVKDAAEDVKDAAAKAADSVKDVFNR